MTSTPQDYLDAQGISLEELAKRVKDTKRVKTSQPSLTRYLRGERRIPADLALAIETVTEGNVTVESLVALRAEKRKLRKPSRRKVRRAA